MLQNSDILSIRIFRYSVTCLITEVFRNSEFKAFEEGLAAKGAIKALVVDHCENYSRKEQDKLTDLAKKNGAKGLVIMKYQNDELEGSPVKFFSEEEKENLNKLMNELAFESFPEIPRSGWTFQALGMKVTIWKMRQNRILRLKVKPLPQEKKEED